MGKLYRINLTCPHCHEEHLSLIIRLTAEEQATIDEFNASHKDANFFDKFVDGPGVIVQRQTICGCCKEEFTAQVGVWEQDALDYDDPNYIRVGYYPVF